MTDPASAPAPEPQAQAPASAAPGNVLTVSQPAPQAPAPAAAPNFNGEEWKNVLPEDLRNDPSLGPIKTLEGMAKSYIHAQKAVGADKIAVPGPYTSEDEWKKIFTKLGVPEDASKYDLRLDDASALDADFINNFKSEAHKAGILPMQAQKLVKWYEQTSKSVQRQMEEQEQQRIASVRAELQTEWGGEYNAKISRAENAINKIIGDNAKEFLDDTLANHPKFIRFASEVGKLLGEDSFRDGKPQAFGDTTDDIKKKISGFMGDPKGPYLDRMHPDHARVVDEVAVLYQKLAMLTGSGN